MSSCGCGCKGKSDVALGDIQTSAPSVVRPLGTETTWRDTIGGWLVRWSIGRMDYSVKPGLYRVGSPDAESPVLVTANYKLTVDLVRSHLTGLNVWLLVLDTKGIHVGCCRQGNLRYRRTRSAELRPWTWQMS